MAFYFHVNNDKAFIAIFSPRCGCTTLKNWFVSSLDQPETDEHTLLKRTWIPHSRLGEFPDHRKLFFIRDPYSRVVSFYCKFVVGKAPEWCFADDLRKYRLEGKTFAEFVQILALLSARGDLLQHHLIPQLEGTQGVSFDEVIPVESLDDLIGALNDELRVSWDPRRLNATNYGPRTWEGAYGRGPKELLEQGLPSKSSFYNDEIIETISSIYREDIEFYRRHNPGQSIPTIC
jgi:hypothetical protein